MKPTVPIATAIEWLEAQCAEINQFRNANTRDASFRQWRQNTLTVIQRVWPGFGSKVQRFRRVPFTPPSSLADSKQVREAFERGCAEAQALLRSWITEIEQHGIRLEEARPVEAAGAEAIDDGTTLDLVGEAPATDPPMVDTSEHGVASIDLPSNGNGSHAAQAAEPLDVEPIARPSENEASQHIWIPPLVLDPRAVEPAGSDPVATAGPHLLSNARSRRTEPAELPQAAEQPEQPELPEHSEQAEHSDPMAAAHAATPKSRPAKKGVRKARLKDLLGLGNFGEPVAEIAATGAPATQETSNLWAQMNSPPAPAEPEVSAETVTPAPPPVHDVAPLQHEVAPFEPPLQEAAPVAPLPLHVVASAAEFAKGNDAIADILAAIAESQAGETLEPVISSPPATHEPALELESVAPAELDDPAFADPIGELEMTLIHDLPPVRDRDEHLESSAASEIALIATEIDRLGVAPAQRDALQQELLALSMTIERGDLDWSALEEAMASVMRHPHLARRAVPVLLPFLRRAA